MHQVAACEGLPALLRVCSALTLVQSPHSLQWHEHANRHIAIGFSTRKSQQTMHCTHALLVGEAEEPNADCHASQPFSTVSQLSDDIKDVVDDGQHDSSAGCPWPPVLCILMPAIVTSIAFLLQQWPYSHCMQMLGSRDAP